MSDPIPVRLTYDEFKSQAAWADAGAAVDAGDSL